MSDTTTVSAVAATSPAAAPVPAASPAAAAVTPEHISALHRHLEQVKEFLISEFHKAVAFVRKAEPIVATVGTAVAEAIPGAGNIVAEVEKVAGVAANMAAAACCAHADQPHGPNGCTATGCSCSAAKN